MKTPSQPLPQLDVSIDENDLATEWANQPKMRHEWGDHLAIAKRDLAAAESALDVVKAETKLNIRNAPSDYGLEKVTEDALKDVLASQPEVKIATKAVIRAKYNVDIIMSAVIAIDHRKSALGNLVDLRAQDYYAEPHAKTKTGKEVVSEARTARARKGMREEDE